MKVVPVSNDPRFMSALWVCAQDTPKDFDSLLLYGCLQSYVLP